MEATATVEPVRGTVTPLIPNLNARADNGRNYQALWEAFMPQGISGATIPQGARSTGEIYFDVTDQTPSRVMYNNGCLLIWEKVSSGPCESRSSEQNCHARLRSRWHFPRIHQPPRRCASARTVGTTCLICTPVTRQRRSGRSITQ